MTEKDILKLPIYRNQKGKYLTKKDIVLNFPHNFKIKEGLDYEYATTSGTTSDRMEIIRKPNWWKDEYERTYSNEKKLKQFSSSEIWSSITCRPLSQNDGCSISKPKSALRSWK